MVEILTEFHLIVTTIFLRIIASTVEVQTLNVCFTVPMLYLKGHRRPQLDKPEDNFNTCLVKQL